MLFPSVLFLAQMKRHRANDSSQPGPEDEDMDEQARSRLQTDVLEDYAAALHQQHHKPAMPNSYARSCALKDGEPPEDFLARLPPATTSPGQAHWLCVQCPRGVLHKPVPYGDPPNISALLEDWSSLCQGVSGPTADSVAFLATKHALVSGSWVASVPRAVVNEAWAAVCRATLSGQLGVFSRCSTRSLSSEHHVVQVSTWSFLDVTDVHRVRHQMQSLGFSEALTYRPDIYNYLGVYPENRWGLQVALFTV